MKKDQLFILLICLFSGISLTSQQLTPFVVSSSGGFYSNSSGMLSFTTGEMTAVETFSSPNTILTQGFQQPWDFGTYINEHPPLDFSYGIYPNPTHGDFNLMTESDITVHVTVKILDALGREILGRDFFHYGKINAEHFDLSNVAQGIYMIALSVRENDYSTEYHFVKKIHIIQ